MLDSNYHMTLLKIMFFWCENIKIFAIYAWHCYGHHYIKLPISRARDSRKFLVLNPIFKSQR